MMKIPLLESILAVAVALPLYAQEGGGVPPTVQINNGLVSAPAGVAFVVKNQTAFAFDIGRAPGSPKQFLGQV